MKEKKTITQLYDCVKDVLLRTENLNAVYIGKTYSEESAEKRHQSEYDDTQIIAVGSPKIISKAEDFFIKNLKKDLSCLVKIDNKREGSAGNPNANMLYVSWNVKYETADQLLEPDFENYYYEITDNLK